MTNIELEKYISTARAQKASDEQILSELIKQGWPEEEVKQVLSPDRNVGLPPPPVPHIGMWVTFQYIILFICLYASATSLGGILHFAVDKLLPDKAAPTEIGRNALLLQGYLASIIVTYPIFAVLFVMLKKQTLEKPAVRNLKARKVLIYMTLVGTFLIMIIHLISTVYGFLSGRATFNSLAHLGVTFLVAGSIFAYLLSEVAIDRKKS